MKAFLRLYPKAWRERYGDEFLALLGHERLPVQDVLDILMAALLARWAQARVSICRWLGQAGAWCAGHTMTLALRIALTGGIAAIVVVLLHVPSGHTLRPIANGALCAGQATATPESAKPQLRCTATGSIGPVLHAVVVMSGRVLVTPNTPISRPVVASTGFKVRCSPDYVVRHGHVSSAGGMTEAQAQRASNHDVYAVSMCEIIQPSGMFTHTSD